MTRPRTNCPEDSELEELGRDLVQWATEKTEEKRTSFCFWYSLKHFILEEHWKLMKQKPAFRPYYEAARSALAQKLHAEMLEKGLAHRYMRLYDRSLADEEDEVIRITARAKAAADQEIKDQAIGQLIQHAETLSKLKDANA